MRAVAECLGRLAAAALLLALPLLPAAAQDGGDAPPIVLKPIPHFSTEAAAREDCPGDAVVWADPVTGFFYPKFLPAYGHGPHGTYTCLDAARRADYWDANPFSDAPMKGREFPIDPSLLGAGV